MSKFIILSSKNEILFVSKRNVINRITTIMNNINWLEEINTVLTIINNPQVTYNTIKNIPTKYIITDNIYPTLMKIMMLTIDYPQVENYLENLLKKFDFRKLDAVHKRNILGHMVCHLNKISYNTFKILINQELDVNFVDNNSTYTPLHYIFSLDTKIDSQSVIDIIYLFNSKNFNFNLKNKFGDTVLDQLCMSRHSSLDLKRVIIVLISLGATNNNMHRIMPEVLEFIQSYRCRNVKAAIR